MELNNNIKLIYQRDGLEKAGSLIKISDDSLIAKFDECTGLRINARVQLVLFHMTMGEMIYEAVIHDVYKNQVYFTNLEYRTNIQRRSETRAKFCTNLEINKILCGDQEISLHKKAILQTVDLSANGIQLCGTIEFPSNTIFHLNIPIDGEIISCDAVVNRKTERDGKFFYGCSLIISEPIRNKIRRHVFRLQLEERKKQKEKKKYNER